MPYHSIDEILRRCGEAVDLGATQVMLQGGHNLVALDMLIERIRSHIGQEI